MASLSCSYMGLELKNPIIIASSPLTSSLEGVKRCEDKGAGAVVLKSIFEEQITDTIKKEAEKNEEYLYSDFASSFESFSKDYYISSYLELLTKAKKELSIPVIASINCTDSEEWGEYITRFASCGADAIELNYYPIAADSKTDGAKVDKRAIAFAKEVRRLTRLPLSIKLGYKYSSLAYIIKAFDEANIDSLVLFNRFFRPDIDIDKLTLKSSSNILSAENEYTEALRWIALMSAEVKTDLCASTGIYSGESVVKLLLAGAKACQICSAAIKDIDVISRMTSFLSEWMDKHNFESISSFTALLAQENISNGSAWERTQYMKNLILGDK